jgi:hypothetical protein
VYGVRADGGFGQLCPRLTELITFGCPRQGCISRAGRLKTSSD